jgi:hypothetical protein
VDEDAVALIEGLSRARVRGLLRRHLAHGLLRRTCLRRLFAAALREAAVPAFLAAVFFAVFFVAVLRAGAFFAAFWLSSSSQVPSSPPSSWSWPLCRLLAGAFLAAFLLVAFFVPLRALPLRLPPPSCLFTVAQAMRSAVPSLAPRSRSLSSMCSAWRFCLSVYADLSPRGMTVLLLL